MAVISNSTFDPLRRYVSVRLQQGVPLVDADWNEMEDVRRFEVRAFLKWFVGDGVPQGNDGFSIVATGAADSFTIAAGSGAAGALDAGRLLVDGFDVFITGDLGFSSQPLHTSQPGAAALAAQWGVPVIAALPPPPAGGTVRMLTAYVDVWERLVTSAEEPSLVHPGLGTESCARMRREWVVRVREAAAVPAPGDPDFLLQHSYCALARIAQDSSGTIAAEHVTDVRRRGLAVPSQVDTQQIVADTFGPGYGIDGTGQTQLAFPLREIVNAQLRNQPIVLGPTLALGAGGPHSSPAAVVDSDGVPWLFWVRSGTAGDLFIAFSRRIAGAWSPPQDAFQVTGVLSIEGLAAAAQPGGVLRVFYSAQSGNWRLFSRRFAAGTWEGEELVAPTGTNQNPAAATDAGGVIHVAWLGLGAAVGGQDVIFARRYPTTGSPLPDESVGNVPGAVAGRDLALVIDPFDAPQVVRIHGTAGAANWDVVTARRPAAGWTALTALGTIPVSTFAELAAVYDPYDSLWLIYATQATAGFSLLRGRRIAVGAPPFQDLVDGSTHPRSPTLIRDAPGNPEVYFRNDAGLERVNLVHFT